MLARGSGCPAPPSFFSFSIATVRSSLVERRACIKIFINKQMNSYFLPVMKMTSHFNFSKRIQLLLLVSKLFFFDERLHIALKYQ